MHAVYEHSNDVKEIAKAGLSAAIEFDDVCGNPIDLHMIDLKNKNTENNIERAEVITVS